MVNSCKDIVSKIEQSDNMKQIIEVYDSIEFYGLINFVTYS